MSRSDGKVSTAGYQRFLEWAQQDQDRRILSEQEYNERVSKFRIRTSPIEQHIEDVYSKIARAYRQLEVDIAELRDYIGKYKKEIEHELTR